MKTGFLFSELGEFSSLSIQEEASPESICLNLYFGSKQLSDTFSLLLFNQLTFSLELSCLFLNKPVTGPKALIRNDFASCSCRPLASFLGLGLIGGLVFLSVVKSSTDDVVIEVLDNVLFSLLIFDSNFDFLLFESSSLLLAAVEDLPSEGDRVQDLRLLWLWSTLVCEVVVGLGSLDKEDEDVFCSDLLLDKFSDKSIASEVGSSEIPKADDSDSAELTELLRWVLSLPFPSGFMFNTDLRKSLLGKTIPDCVELIFEYAGD